VLEALGPLGTKRSLLPDDSKTEKNGTSIPPSIPFDDLEFNQGKLQRLQFPDEILFKTGFYVPNQMNYGTVDGVYIDEERNEVLLLQCTVSLNHPLKVGPLLEIVSYFQRQRENVKFFFIFMVPKFYDPARFHLLTT